MVDVQVPKVLRVRYLLILKHISTLDLISVIPRPPRPWKWNLTVILIWNCPGRVRTQGIYVAFCR